MSKTTSTKYMQDLKDGDEAEKLRRKEAGINALDEVKKAITSTETAISTARTQIELREVQIARSRMADPFSINKVLRLWQGENEFNSSDLSSASTDQLTQYIDVQEMTLIFLNKILSEDHTEK